MALPAPLLDAFPAFEQVAQEEDPRAPIEVIIERTKRIEAMLRGIKLDEIFPRVEENARIAGIAGCAEIEKVIGQLQDQESELAAKLVPMIRASRTLQNKSFRASHLSTGERAKLVNALDRHRKALTSILQLYRDERWRMMALLAEIRPEGDGPVFSDPKELEHYLDQL